MADIKNGMRPIHPGEILREEFLMPYGLTAQTLAAAIHLPTGEIAEIIEECRAVTADTALRLARYFGTSAEFWMGLQTDYDLRRAEQAAGGLLDRIQGIAA